MYPLSITAHGPHSPVMFLLLQWILSGAQVLAVTSRMTGQTPIISLQDPHGRPSPSQVLQEMADYMKSHEGESENNKLINTAWDIYGDFEKTVDESFLRRFEEDMAYELGMEDSVFMPSGVMAQSIALLIHRDMKYFKNKREPMNINNASLSFICHETSHLILHEQDGYKHLLNLEPIIVSTKEKADGISNPPMKVHDIISTIEKRSETFESLISTVVALIVEVPHREIGGKLNSFEELSAMRDFCKINNIAFHCDGARIFEASAGGNALDHEHDGKDNERQWLAKFVRGIGFDSLYVSCYKGLGGLSGAFLLGNAYFCNEARVWLRRFGGNLYTLLPYAISARMGYEREWKSVQHQQNVESFQTDERKLKSVSLSVYSFVEKRRKLHNIVKQLSSDQNIARWLSFDPPVPETNMIHGYLKDCTMDDCIKASLHVQETKNVLVVRKFRSVDPKYNPSAFSKGYRVMFEWTMGQFNAQYENEIYLESWTNFCNFLIRKK